MRRLFVLFLSVFFIVLTAGRCDSESAADGSKGGACYANNTCDDGLSCVDDQCVPNTTTSGDGDADADNDGDEEDKWTLDETIEETSEILCERLVMCYGEDDIDEDECVDDLEKELTNEGCKNFDAEQAEPCINCLDDDLDCSEIEGIIVYGYPLNQFCNVCDLMCD